MAKANVGDKIKIVRPILASGYGMGDILTVRELEDNGVRVEEIAGWVHNAEFEVAGPEATTLESATMEQILEEIRRRTVVSDEDSLVAPFEPDAPMAKAVPTREAIVRQAMSDVDTILARGRTASMNGGSEGNSTYRDNFYSVEFIVNKEKRTVVALVKNRIHSGFIKHRGIAKCDPSDCFNEHIGKAIAVRRAFELDVPRGYLNAPAPEPEKGAEVGDMVEYKGKVYEIVPSHKNTFGRKVAHPKSVVGYHGTVVDDTARYQD